MSIGQRYVILVISDAFRHPTPTSKGTLGVQATIEVKCLTHLPGSNVISLRRTFLTNLTKKQTKNPKQHKMTHPGLFHSYHLNSIWKYLFLCLYIVSVLLDMSSMREQTLFEWSLLYPWHVKRFLKYSRCFKKLWNEWKCFQKYTGLVFIRLVRLCRNDCHWRRSLYSQIPGSQRHSIPCKALGGSTRVHQEAKGE